VHRGRVPGGHAYTRTIHTDASGRGIFEYWNIHGAGHVVTGVTFERSAGTRQRQQGEKVQQKSRQADPLVERRRALLRLTSS